MNGVFNTKTTTKLFYFIFLIKRWIMLDSIRILNKPNIKKYWSLHKSKNNWFQQRVKYSHLWAYFRWKSRSKTIQTLNKITKKRHFRRHGYYGLIKRSRATKKPPKPIRTKQNIHIRRSDTISNKPLQKHRKSLRWIHYEKILQHNRKQQRKATI